MFNKIEYRKKFKYVLSPYSRLRLAQRLKLMLRDQNVMLKDMAMEVMANTAKRLLKKLPTMCLYLPQLISLSRLVLFSIIKDMFNLYHYKHRCCSEKIIRKS